MSNSGYPFESELTLKLNVAESTVTVGEMPARLNSISPRSSPEESFRVTMLVPVVLSVSKLPSRPLSFAYPSAEARIEAVAMGSLWLPKLTPLWTWPSASVTACLPGAAGKVCIQPVCVSERSAT